MRITKGMLARAGSRAAGSHGAGSHAAGSHGASSQGAGHAGTQPTMRELLGPVRPLKASPGRVPPKAAVIAPPARPPERAGAPDFSIEDDGTRIEGTRTGEAAALRQLFRGRPAVVATLDLHRLTAAEGEQMLRRFCELNRGPRRSAVLVVHGRGTHSPGGRGILRDEIAGWLSSPPLAHHVLCFTTAAPRDGGAGALYVFLAPRIPASRRRGP